MNILKNYTVRLNGFSVSDMTKILNYTHSRYSLERKGINMYVISDTNSSDIKLVNLKCICETFTLNQNGTKLKLANTNGKCFNCKKAFGLSYCDDCVSCNQEALILFKANKLNVVRKLH